MDSDINLIKQLYEDFNARKVDALLAKLTEDVMWANGMEGGYVQGHQSLKDYWERQWSSLNPQIKAVGFSQTKEGALLVDALFNGKCLEQEFKDIPAGHVFYIKNGIVSRFDIQGRSEDSGS
jgi:hypothetical protein